MRQRMALPHSLTAESDRSDDRMPAHVRNAARRGPQQGAPNSRSPTCIRDRDKPAEPPPPARQTRFQRSLAEPRTSRPREASSEALFFSFSLASTHRLTASFLPDHEMLILLSLRSKRYRPAAQIRQPAGGVQPLNQFSDGFSAWSTTSTSTGIRFDFNVNPSCCTIAVDT
jgi:hypothetical protein